jgi:hypothetical protein
VVEVHSDDEDEHHDETGAFCDIVGCTTPGTQRPIKLSEVRVKCNVCRDYDLCLACYQAGKTNRGHAVDHKVCIIRNTRVVAPEDLTSSEAVNPQITNRANPARLAWVSSEIRDPDTDAPRTVKHLRLFADNSHARFLFDLKPGHYIVEVKLKFEYFPSCGTQALGVIRDNGAGNMRVSLGTAANQRDFRRGQYSEDAVDPSLTPLVTLPGRLLQGVVSRTFAIPKGDITYCVTFNKLMHVAGDDVGALKDIGLVIQWASVPQFSPTDPDAVVQVYVDEIR